MTLQQQCRSPDLVPALDMQPTEGLGCLGAAVYEVDLINGLQVKRTSAVRQDMAS